MVRSDQESLSGIRLVWYQRDDGYWNAECACGATLCGVRDFERGPSEAWHFLNTEESRQRGDKYLPCEPKLPTPDPNRPDPFRFR